MHKGLIITEEAISTKIFVIREQKVILDRDLAMLYGVETKYLKRQVRRNIDRFPVDFMFELNKEESLHLRSQFGTSKRGGNRYAPMAFTEQGVAMLSSVLNSDIAIQINIQIIRVFTKIRTIYADKLNLKLEIEAIKNKLSNQSKNIELVFNYLDELNSKLDKPKKPRNKIGYKK
jgi:hypothetical protein